jgi:hypothetical protein
VLQECYSDGLAPRQAQQMNKIFFRIFRRDH